MIQCKWWGVRPLDRGQALGGRGLTSLARIRGEELSPLPTPPPPAICRQPSPPPHSPPALTLQAVELPRAVLPRDVLPVGASRQGHHGAQRGGPLTHPHLELCQGRERVSATPGPRETWPRKLHAGSCGSTSWPISQSVRTAPWWWWTPVGFTDLAASVLQPAGNSASIFLGATSLQLNRFRQTPPLILGVSRWPTSGQ